jgi:hypothetical protein
MFAGKIGAYQSDKHSGMIWKAVKRFIVQALDNYQGMAVNDQGIVL